MIVAVAGAAVAVCLFELVPARLRARLAATNVRGATVPATLGTVVAATVVGTSAILSAADLLTGPRRAFGEGAAVPLLALGLVFAVGLVDDLAAGRARGLRGHLAAAARGHLTTGLLKVAGVLAAAALLEARFPGRSWPDRVAGVLAMAGFANVLNGLDVVPGRALKAFLLAAVPLAVLFPSLEVWLAVGAALAIGGFDLRERAMLGDGGANLLGFLVGAVMAANLRGPALWSVAALAVALNVLAETVSFSRIIRSTPPLRWFDGLGRLPDPEPEDADGPGSTG